MVSASMAACHRGSARAGRCWAPQQHPPPPRQHQQRAEKRPAEGGEQAGEDPRAEEDPPHHPLPMRPRPHTPPAAGEGRPPAAAAAGEGLPPGAAAAGAAAAAGQLSTRSGRQEEEAEPRPLRPCEEVGRRHRERNSGMRRQRLGPRFGRGAPETAGNRREEGEEAPGLPWRRRRRPGSWPAGGGGWEEGEEGLGC